jgi:hypothetical protein
MTELGVASGPAVISLGGFAIQRALQILDPFIDWLTEATKEWWKVHHVEDTGTVKRAAVAICALVLSGVIVWALDIGLLSLVGVSGHVWGDRLVSALVLSAGSEGANSVLKVLEAFKQSRQAVADGVAVVVATPEVTAKANSQIRLRATITNSANQDIEWTFVENARVAVASDGTMTVPATPGVFHVIAASEANRAKTAVVKLTVTA